MGSMSPSSTIHLGLSLVKLDMSLMMVEYRPAFPQAGVSKHSKLLWVYQQDQAAKRNSNLTVLPLSRGGVDEAEELKGGDCLWVDVHPDRLQTLVPVGLVQRAKDLTLA